MANPLTCQHNIITAVVNVETLDQWFSCGSCNTRLPMEWIKARKGIYEYDKGERCWVYMSKMKAEFLAETRLASVRSDDILRESKIAVVGTDKVVESEASLVADAQYNDGDWFLDIQGEYQQIWEVQYNIDLNEHVWVAVIHPMIWKPRGCKVDRPVFPGDVA